MPRFISFAFLSAVALLISIGFPDHSFAQGWYDANWHYRKSHTINSATGAGTNYQVMITVHYGAGTDGSPGAGDVYCNTHCKTDFGDIRFTASDGTTLLSYWIQSSVASNNAVFWVKVSADLGSSAQSVFVYYSNLTATTTSSTGTFIYYDDGSSTTGWTLSGTSGTTIGIQSTVGNPVNAFFASTNPTAGTQYYMYKNTGIAPNTFTSFNVQTTTGNLGNFYFLSDVNGAGQMYRIETRVSASSGFATTARWSGGTLPWGSPTTGPTATSNTWYRFGIGITSSTSATLYYDQTTSTNPVVGTALSPTSTYTVTNSGTYIGLGGDALGGANTIRTFWDNIITRKYVSPEPAQGAWGTEALAVSASFTNTTCYAQPTGTATVVSVTGGYPPYTYSWNSVPPQTTQTATQLPAGTYTVIVTDNSGVTGSASTLVGQPSVVTATVNGTTNISCYNGTNGSITINAGGGNGIYQYSIDNGGNWEGSGSSYTFSINPAGTYRTRVKDGNGCMSPAIP